MAALSRDRKPQEDESEENKQRLKDEVHFCIGKVMEAKDPMDPDDIEAQDEAYARERAPKERGRSRSLLQSRNPISAAIAAASIAICPAGAVTGYNVNARTGSGCVI